MTSKYMGIEIGGTKQQICILNENAQELDFLGERVELREGAPDILAWLKVNVQRLLRKYPDVRSIGVGFGGPLEMKTGRVLTSIQVPGWKDFELKTWFEREFNIPTIVVVDTVAGGYAELICGSGKGSESFFYTNLGTGIGGSWFYRGKVFDGIGFGGSFLGNTYTADWTAKVPGSVTRVEDLCCGIAIERRLRSPGYVANDSLLMALCDEDIQKLDCRMLGIAAAKKDAFALEELDRVGHSFGIAVANTVSMMAPNIVSIGGGLANIGEPLRAPIQKYANQYVFISGKDRFEVVICQLMDRNVPIGAALFAKNGFPVL